MTKQESVPADRMIQNELVVVHRMDGTLSRGILEWDTTTRQVVPPAPLPEVLHIRCDNQDECSLVVEGRTENDARLLFDSGIWLRPFDSTGNNILVYVPKSSVVEFHVMGVAVHRAMVRQNYERPENE